MEEWNRLPMDQQDIQQRLDKTRVRLSLTRDQILATAS